MIHIPVILMCVLILIGFIMALTGILEENEKNTKLGTMIMILGLIIGIIGVEF